ncbi:MAG: ribosomal protein [Hydrocarboniphaga sp.]|uniref:50S ribosomal protein L6 n=1 Tax=Hydrocarboniphaga sp. TaxID=2033016 RepID=UPI00263413B7|nr:50S ribosomal protein L6 [Hydrocarboniphaga sp.]MDB5973205.1 ribosomal protein [Hydrocarboniphaga sp.]
MSRVAKMPVVIPAGVTVTSEAGVVTVKGAKSTQTVTLAYGIVVDIANGEAVINAESVKTNAMQAGTIRALLNNAVTGVTKGYERKLQLVGVGYRASVANKKVNLQVGLSHPVDHPIPDGLNVVCPTQTEIVITGASKHMVGQLAAQLRSYRPPEPYKGKGVRYSDEKVVLKEAKKK